MKRLAIILSALLLISSGADAQNLLRNLGERAKNALENKLGETVENKVENAVDDAIDGKNKKKNKKNDKAAATVPQEEVQVMQNSEAEAPETARTQAPKQAQIKNAKDFVRGEVELFRDSFEDDPIGEFPAHWDLVKGVAEVVSIDGVKAVKISGSGSITPYIEPNIRNYLPEEFTLEFKVFVNNEFDKNGFSFYDEKEEEMMTEQYSRYRIDHIGKIQTGSDFSPELEDGWHLFQISYNKGAYKVFADGVRVVNSPRENQPSFLTLDVIDFDLAYYTDIILCQGAKEKHEQQATRLTEVEKAMQETGKFVTNNILFETGKADLKPESMEEIQKVADYMKKNPDVRFEVQGHTDNQGSDKVNDPLSQKRAEAVVKALAGMGVDEWNLRPVGKGSHEPVADNRTDEGRAKNRRVEFIKK